jgi:hypothetical protein
VNETDLGMVCPWPGVRGSTAIATFGELLTVKSIAPVAIDNTPAAGAACSAVVDTTTLLPLLPLLVPKRLSIRVTAAMTSSGGESILLQ